ncbi:MAG TPA: carboxypeptidase-like regulatory domain-containing protein, partial [Chitinophagaceae bacterium]|nr:carboxypeptidase-like regulatory domain-containing protein [Chitinophagaceae bacterium]
MSKRKLSFCWLLLMMVTLSLSGFAQQKRRITGRVADERSNPVGGASVTEKGTTNGTTTDANGTFSLMVSPKAVLVISYVGFQSQEVLTTNASAVNVTLKEGSS